VNCDQAAKAKLSAMIIVRRAGRVEKRIKLASVTRHVSASKATEIKLRLSHRLLGVLDHHAHAHITLRLVAVDANGRSTATALVSNVRR